MFRTPTDRSRCFHRVVFILFVLFFFLLLIGFCSSLRLHLCLCSSFCCCFPLRSCFALVFGSELFLCLSSVEIQIVSHKIRILNAKRTDRDHFSIHYCQAGFYRDWIWWFLCSFLVVAPLSTSSYSLSCRSRVASWLNILILWMFVVCSTALGRRHYFFTWREKKINGIISSAFTCQARGSWIYSDGIMESI